MPLPYCNPVRAPAVRNPSLKKFLLELLICFAVKQLECITAFNQLCKQSSKKKTTAVLWRAPAAGKCAVTRENLSLSWRVRSFLQCELELEINVVSGSVPLSHRHSSIIFITPIALLICPFLQEAHILLSFYKQ